MPNSDLLNHCIPDDQVDQLPIYENKQQAREAVDEALNAWMQEKLIDWARQQVQFRREPANKKKFTPLFLDYFDASTLEVMENLFNEIDHDASHDSSEFLNIFSNQCLEKLKEKNGSLLYQGSSSLVFYRDGQFIRALKPEIQQSGLREKNNKNLRIIGSENKFKKRGFSFSRFFSRDNPIKVPHLTDIIENQIIFDPRQGILIVYEKELEAKIGAEFYSILDKAIADMVKKRAAAQANHPEIKVNIKMLMDDLYKAVCSMQGLLSCHLYDIEKKPGENGEEVIQAYRYTVKKNTLDPVDAALKDYEKKKNLATPIEVKANVSINHHYWEMGKGYIGILVATLFLAAPFLSIAGVFLFLQLWPIAIPAVCVALIVPSVYAWKKINQLERSTKNTEEYSDPTLARLNSFRKKNIITALCKEVVSLAGRVINQVERMVHEPSLEISNQQPPSVTENNEPSSLASPSLAP